MLRIVAAVAILSAVPFAGAQQSPALPRLHEVPGVASVRTPDDWVKADAGATTSRLYTAMGGEIAAVLHPRSGAPGVPPYAVIELKPRDVPGRPTRAQLEAAGALAHLRFTTGGGPTGSSTRTLSWRSDRETLVDATSSYSFDALFGAGTPAAQVVMVDGTLGETGEVVLSIWARETDARANAAVYKSMRSSFSSAVPRLIDAYDRSRVGASRGVQSYGDFARVAAVVVGIVLALAIGTFLKGRYDARSSSPS